MQLIEQGPEYFIETPSKVRQDLPKFLRRIGAYSIFAASGLLAAGSAMIGTAYADEIKSNPISCDSAIVLGPTDANGNPLVITADQANLECTSEPKTFSVPGIVGELGTNS